MSSAFPSPLPQTVRLVCTRPWRGKPPPAPLGLTWSDAGSGGVAVVLDLPTDWPSSGLGDIGVVACQLPERSSLVTGQLLLVLPRAAGASSWLGRLPGARPRIAGAIRATALLARGYAEIGAGLDPSTKMDLVWALA